MDCEAGIFLCGLNEAGKKQGLASENESDRRASVGGEGAVKHVDGSGKVPSPDGRIGRHGDLSPIPQPVQTRLQEVRV